MEFTRKNLLEYVLSKDSRPTYSNFRALCESKILQVFPNADRKKVKDAIVKNYCSKVIIRWNRCNPTPKTVSKHLFNNSKQKSWWDTAFKFDEIPTIDKNSPTENSDSNTVSDITTKTASLSSENMNVDCPSDEERSFLIWQNGSPKRRLQLLRDIHK